jgi:signal transduction histidine kinase
MSLAAQLLELRLGELKEDETVHKSVRVLKDQILHLSRLLYEFSALSRRQRLTFRSTNLCDLVHDVLTTELPLYTGQEIVVEQRFAPHLPMLQVDQDKLKQVVLNLCRNAVEAMPDGGTLTLRVHNKGEHLHLEVMDTGVGIPEGVNIFEPFVTTKKEGTGLGLSIVRQIVDAHGGALTYTSEAGKGTTFVVTLPLTPR